MDILRQIAVRLMRLDPDVLNALRAWLDATISIWKLFTPPEASLEVEAMLAAVAAESELPGRIGDGTILELLRKLSAFIESHPEILTLVLKFLA